MSWHCAVRRGKKRSHEALHAVFATPTLCMTPRHCCEMTSTNIALARSALTFLPCTRYISSNLHPELAGLGPCEATSFTPRTPHSLYYYCYLFRVLFGFDHHCHIQEKTDICTPMDASQQYAYSYWRFRVSHSQYDVMKIYLESRAVGGGTLLCIPRVHHLVTSGLLLATARRHGCGKAGNGWNVL